MDITILKSDLSRALSFTESIIEKKTTMPILANVLLSGTGKALKISATDLEITAVVSAPADVHAKGSTTVNARVLADIVRELPEGEVNLKLTEGERLEITSKKLKLRIIGVSAEEFPSLPGISVDAKNKIQANHFLEMINKTLYSVSTDQTRFNLNGVCFENADAPKAKKGLSSLRMVATDGHRLAMITRPISGLSLTERVIVPRKGLSEIRKILDDQGENEVGMDINEGFLVLETQDAKISMRLIDGEFPDYNQVLPKDKGVAAVVSGEELSQALRRVALMVTDKAKCVRFDFGKGVLKIFSSSPELGDAREEIQAKYDGQPLSLGFNARYLLDFAASLTENQSLTIELHGELGPGRFKAGDDESYCGIIMPMRLQ